MDLLQIYAVTLAGVALAQASPGPNMMAVASTGLAQGKRFSLGVVGGVATGMLIWAVAAALGLALFFEAFPSALIGLRFVGGAYLLWLGFKAIRAFFQNKAVSIAPSKRQLTFAGSWMRGLAVILTNPKAALMWSAVATYLYGQNLEAWQVVVFGPMAAITAILIYGSYAMLFSSQIAIRSYARFTRWFEAGFGAAFALFGGRLIFDGLVALRSRM
jgi:threonine/homoserine/homoserine lactone efflux protein